MTWLTVFFGPWLLGACVGVVIGELLGRHRALSEVCRDLDEALELNEALKHCETVKGLCAQIKQLQSDLAEATNELNQQDRRGRERPDGGGGSGIPFYPHERKFGYLITNKENER